MSATDTLLGAAGLVVLIKIATDVHKIANTVRGGSGPIGGPGTSGTPVPPPDNPPVVPPVPEPGDPKG